ncbi:MAG TPA: hypothetical protein VK139_04045 [Microbacteriaceae bacterium]|nr:hypothetical protein [Microbacteriaceae bacterium]
MARSKKPSTSEAPVLDAAFWSEFGLDEHAGTRDKLRFLAFAEISRRGILDVNARWLTDSLHADPSAINYHFGSFDGLIAEVFVTAHELWAEAIRKALAVPAETPEERLRNVLNAQIARSQRYGAVVGVAHLPHVSEQVTKILETEHPGKIAETVAYAVGVTAHLIRDLRRNVQSPITFAPEDTPVDWTVEHMPLEVHLASFVQWSVVGPVLWMTGQGGGVREIENLREDLTSRQLWGGYIDWLVASIQMQLSQAPDL